MISSNNLKQILTGLFNKNKEEHDKDINHLSINMDKGWISSYDLKVGDELTSPKVGLIKIKTIKVKEYKEAITVYNLGVKNNHNYLVTDYEILVHNVAPSISKNA